jgi:hypothetical protein
MNFSAKVSDLVELGFELGQCVYQAGALLLETHLQFICSGYFGDGISGSSGLGWP